MVKPLPVTYTLLGCFVPAERRLRQGPEVARLEAGRTDQGMTRAIGQAFGRSLLALALAPLVKEKAGSAPKTRLLWRFAATTFLRK